MFMFTSKINTFSTGVQLNFNNFTALNFLVFFCLLLYLRKFKLVKYTGKGKEKISKPTVVYT